MKWVIIIAVIAIGYAVYTGNLGGASNATSNYMSIRSGG